MIKPFFSVIILTFNRTAMLREAIQSVLDQTFKDFEILVIDDHSTDNTKEVVELFNEERIRYFVNDRTKGQPGARNTGLSRSVGEWVTFLDDDDVWLPLKLEKQYHKIQEIDNTVGIINTGFAYYDFENKKKLSEVIPEKEGWIQKDLLYGNCIGAICTVAVRNDLFKKVGGYDENFQSMVDLEMWVRLSAVSRVENVKDILVYIRKSNTDRISVNTWKKLKGSIQFWDKYKDLINSNYHLKNHTASRVFLYAIRENNKEELMRSLTWTLAGIFVNPNKFLRVCWGAILIISNSERGRLQ